VSERRVDSRVDPQVQPGAPSAAPGGENPAVRFEHIDADPAAVAKWAVGLGVLTIAAAAVSVWLLVFLRRREERSDPERPALYFSSERRQPEGVRLQTSPFGDIRALREHEHQILTTYGWVDQPTGVVHIPIEEAMRLYVQRQAGVAAAGAPGAPGTPTVSSASVPTDSAPVPSPAVATSGAGGGATAAPLPTAAAPPAAKPSPVPSGPPGPPAPHGPGPAPSGGHR